MGLVWYDWDGSVLIASSNQLNKKAEADNPVASKVISE